jgi:hypothetical protein
LEYLQNNEYMRTNNDCVKFWNTLANSLNVTGDGSRLTKEKWEAVSNDFLNNKNTLNRIIFSN